MSLSRSRARCLAVIFGERHLEHLLREYVAFYNSVRPYQGTENRLIGTIPFPNGTGPPDPSEIGCDSRLGGVLRYYHHRAA